tara:strand:+ start:132 stop:287 length:156 start_codon:yes stop_codon:yes gene_type:complete
VVELIHQHHLGPDLVDVELLAKEMMVEILHVMVVQTLEEEVVDHVLLVEME